jgi:type I restriction enzyme R subunit
MPFNKDGNTGIIIVKDMLLTGFDAPIEQVLYIDRKLINHNLLQAVARVNRICGADKKCGYIVDYVGITRHLKEALAEYANMEAEDSPVNSLMDISKDVNRLNEAYTRILTFIRDKTGFDFRKQTASVIEELVANEELRNEFNNLFRELSKYYDRVLPNPRALEYRNDINVFAFIRTTVANRTRDPRYSMNDASAKVRAIIEEYLRVNGVGLEVQSIDILSSAFISGVQKPDKSDRAAVDEIIYAVREYITKNTPKDPELFERLSERLNGILEKFKGNWKLLRTNLVPFVTIDLPNARKNENSYGYDMEKEMPFFALLRREIFGNQTFDELKQDDFNALRTLTNECLSILKRETRKVDFWRREAQILEMRTNIREMLMDMERTAPSIEEKKDDIVQKIVELGKEHYK